MNQRDFETLLTAYIKMMGGNGKTKPTMANLMASFVAAPGKGKDKGGGKGGNKGGGKCGKPPGGSQTAGSAGKPCWYHSAATHDPQQWLEVPHTRPELAHSHTPSS